MLRLLCLIISLFLAIPVCSSADSSSKYSFDGYLLSSSGKSSNEWAATSHSQADFLVTSSFDIIAFDKNNNSELIGMITGQAITNNSIYFIEAPYTVGGVFGGTDNILLILYSPELQLGEYHIYDISFSTQLVTNLLDSLVESKKLTEYHSIDFNIYLQRFIAFSESIGN